MWSPLNSTDIRDLERLHSQFTSSVSSPDNSNLLLSKRRVFHKALQIFKIVKISPPCLHDTFSFAVAVLVGTNIDYLFLELKIIMVNGHWHTGAQPFGTDYHQHLIVPKLR